MTSYIFTERLRQYVNSNQEVFPRRQIFSFPANQGYIKANCKSFLGITQIIGPIFHPPLSKPSFLYLF